MEHGDFPACHVSFHGCGTIFYLLSGANCSFPGGYTSIAKAQRRSCRDLDASGQHTSRGESDGIKLAASTRVS